MLGRDLDRLVEVGGGDEVEAGDLLASLAELDPAREHLLGPLDRPELGFDHGARGLADVGHEQQVLHGAPSESKGHNARISMAPNRAAGWAAAIAMASSSSTASIRS